ncbi:MAG: response regulator, partial [Gemmatimonadaceae bacterium]|nr:response regulator [Acetobacteraceae bacterium]
VAVAAPAEARRGQGLLQGRILVADDDKTNRWLSQRQLELLGLEVEVAEHGAMALGLLRAKPYDLLLTDCHMPQMDGVALTQAVRAAADPVLRSLPVIGLTADVSGAQRRRCAEAGMTELAYKPLSREALAAFLSRALGARPNAGLGAGLGASLAAVAPKVATADPVPAFDPAQYFDLFEPGDEDGPAWLHEYLDAAADVCAGMAERLSGSSDMAARPDVVALAHKLVGSSVSVGAAPVGALARILEHAAAAAPLTVLQEQLGAIRAELDTVRRQIMAFVDRGSEPG